MKTGTFLKFGKIILFLLILAGCASSRSINNKADLREAILAKLEQLEGNFAVAFQNVDDPGQSVMINEHEMFHAASTMKTPVMIEVFKQAKEGEFNLGDSVLVENKFYSIVDSSEYSMDISEDGGEQLYDYIGKKRTMRQLVDDMIKVSSNLATNILIKRVGAKNVTQTMRTYGADSIRVLRGVEDIKAFNQGLNNRTTAYDLMVIFEKLARHEAVSAEASDEMIDILKDQHYNDMIPAELPDNVEVAHKTGWITGVHHDSGIVFLPDGGRYVLVLLSKNAPDREKVLSTFADISRMIYDFVTKGG